MSTVSLEESRMGCAIKKKNSLNGLQKKILQIPISFYLPFIFSSLYIWVPIRVPAWAHLTIDQGKAWGIKSPVSGSVRCGETLRSPARPCYTSCGNVARGPSPRPETSSRPSPVSGGPSSRASLLPSWAVSSTQTRVLERARLPAGQTWEVRVCSTVA